MKLFSQGELYSSIKNLFSDAKQRNGTIVEAYE